MLDIRWIRENPDALDRALKNRGAEPAAGRLIGLDEARRAAIQKLQDAQTRRNAASKEIGQAKAAKDSPRAEALMAEVAALKHAIKAGEEAERAAIKALDDALAEIPNVPLEGEPPAAPPVGDESANYEVRTWGGPKWYSEPEQAGRRHIRLDDRPRRPGWIKEHFELGEALGQMDFETAAKLSGSRFVVLKGPLARMERALGQFMLDLHTQEHGYTEAWPPILVQGQSLYGTAQLPKFRDEQFSIYDRNLEKQQIAEFLETIPVDFAEPERVLDAYEEYEPRLAQGEFGRLWLIPTAEVSLTNLVRESILDESSLPLRYTALTPCFRSEAGSAGKDTRGMLRQHQFDKVELVSITTPEQSRAEHERMTMCAEEVLKQLDLAYRVVLLSTGDMGFASQKTYDLEVWLPGQKAYREISSCSVCGDFQARRMDARYRPNGGKPEFVHTLNGSGVAVGRALIAVMETYQNQDGSIAVPDVLRPYMGGLARIGP